MSWGNPAYFIDIKPLILRRVIMALIALIKSLLIELFIQLNIKVEYIMQKQVERTERHAAVMEISKYYNNNYNTYI